MLFFFMYLSQRGTREKENDEHFVSRGKTEAKVGKEAMTMQSPTEFNSNRNVMTRLVFFLMLSVEKDTPGGDTDNPH